MLAALDPRPARPRLVPARRAGQGGDARGGGARRSRGRATGPRARRRASSPATTTAPFSRATASRRGPGAIVDEDGRRLGVHDGSGASRPASGAGSASPPSEPLYVLGTDAEREHGRRRPAQALARGASWRAGRLYVAGRRGSRRSSATARRPSRRGFEPTAAASRSTSTSRPTPSRPARPRCSTTATSSSGAAGHSGATLRSQRNARRRIHVGGSLAARARGLPPRRRAALAYLLLRLGGTVRPRFLVDQGPSGRSSR